MAKKKKKKGIQLVLLFFILIALIVAYVIYSAYEKKEKSDNETNEDENLTLWTIDESEVQSIAFQNDTSDLTIVKNQDGAWVIQDRPELPLNQTYATKMLSYMKNMSVMELVQKDVKDLSDFGLDTPSIKATVTKTDGSKETILVGLQSSVSTDSYVCKEGSSDVYYASSSFVNAFSYSELELTDAGIAPSITPANITKLLIEDNEKGNLEIVLDSQNEYDWSDSGVAPYYLKQGYDVPVPGNMSNITYFLANYENLSYQKCVAYDCEDPSTYGIRGEKRIVVNYYIETKADPEDENSEVVQTNVVYRLSIGSLTEDGTAYYVMDEDNKNVYLMSKDTVDVMTTYDLFNLTSVYIQLFNIKKVDEVEYTYEGVTHLLTIEHKTEVGEDGKETEEEFFKLDGVDQEEDDLCRDYYKALISPLNDAVIPEGYDDSDKPVVVSFRFVRSEGTPKEVITEYKDYDESFYTVTLNGSERFLVDKRDITQVNKALENLINDVKKEHN